MHSILYSLMDPRNSRFNTEFLADAFMIISTILLEGIYIYIYIKKMEKGCALKFKYLSYGFRLHQVFFFFFSRGTERKYLGSIRTTSWMRLWRSMAFERKDPETRKQKKESWCERWTNEQTASSRARNLPARKELFTFFFFFFSWSVFYIRLFYKNN